MSGKPLILPSLTGRRSRGPILAGAALIAVTFGGFGTWAAVAPLARGAVAHGIVVAESERKTVQHLEGGIVAEILARDGDAVAAGQVLVRLDSVQPQTRLTALETRFDALQGQIARLLAERDGTPEPDFPASLAARQADPRIARLIRGEGQLFRTRRDALAGEVRLLEQQQEQVAGRIQGLTAQIAALDEQIKLIDGELVGLVDLFQKGFTSRQRMLDLQRRAADLRGQRAAQASEVAQLHIRINDAKLNIIQARNKFREEVLASLRDSQSEAASIEQDIAATRDILRRVEVKAPQAGIVHHSQVHTIGGIVAPGSPIMEIVPDSSMLVLDARLNPTDIEHVHPGTDAEIRLTGLPQRSTPVVQGTVATVSPDVLTDAQSGASYYSIRIQVPEAQRARLDGVTLHPGMPAEIVLKSGERTALEYFTEPLTLALMRSFKE